MLLRHDKWTRDLWKYKNRDGHVIIIYDNDERAAAPCATCFMEKGYDNIIMVTGGLEAFAESHSESLVGIIPPSLEDAIARRQGVSPKRRGGGRSGRSDRESGMTPRENRMGGRNRRSPGEIGMGERGEGGALCVLGCVRGVTWVERQEVFKHGNHAFLLPTGRTTRPDEMMFAVCCFLSSPVLRASARRPSLTPFLLVFLYRCAFRPLSPLSSPPPPTQGSLRSGYGGLEGSPRGSAAGSVRGGAAPSEACSERSVTSAVCDWRKK